MSNLRLPEISRRLAWFVQYDTATSGVPSEGNHVFVPPRRSHHVISKEETACHAQITVHEINLMELVLQRLLLHKADDFAASSYGLVFDSYCDRRAGKVVCQTRW